MRSSECDAEAVSFCVAENRPLQSDETARGAKVCGQMSVQV